MNMRLGMQIVLALLLSLMVTSHVYAQATAANAAGRVTGTDGQGLEGVSVELVHVPSGTRSRTTTDADGRWSARGLRVGGPYTLSASREGLQTTVQEDLYFLLGETGTVNVTLERTAELGRVVVTGVALSDVFDPMKMGAGTNVTRQQIEALPSISRNIQDYMRTDPRISQVDKERGEISAGGQNTRFNNIRIDGVSTNDAFGLEANNLPTDRQPISIDS
ncbi:MAG TPA: carboxypeptidase-like regulatory domain-containing protein, partial [Xanthomonadaceae bacterium]|nr:carboxypeptidase-like regulatory domain-containing protein [Xanthomonadaceae bacterium]